MREKYAQEALILFLPFQKDSDLRSSFDNTYWTSFLHKKKAFMWEKGVEILQNNQDLFNLKNMKRVKDHLHTSTKLRSKEKSDFNVEDDSDDNMFSFK